MLKVKNNIMSLGHINHTSDYKIELNTSWELHIPLSFLHSFIVTCNIFSSAEAPFLNKVSFYTQ